MRIVITISFFALAAWFVVGARGTSVPADLGGSADAPVDLSLIDPSPLRNPIGDPATAPIAGMQLKCNQCHALFTSRLVTWRKLQQHRDLVHDHGENDRCFNCHDFADRSKLVLHDGELIGFEDAVRLCAKCHGPTWRDWQKGMHGRTMGSWDAASGKQVRLECIQCHDPHAPAFAPIAPLPGPDTLRMGRRKARPQEGRHDVRNPLELRPRGSEGVPDHGLLEEGIEE